MSSRALLSVILAGPLGADVCMSSAHAATTVNCKAGRTITQAINALRPAAGYQQINVLGSCTEQVFVPTGLAVAITGAKGASLQPPQSYTGPTVEVQGKLVVQTLAVVGTSFTAFQVNGISGGTLQISDVAITGPGQAIYASNNASVLVQASTVSAPGNPAINVDQSSLEVDGFSFYSASTTSSVTSSGGDGIGCYSGGTVKLNAGPGSVAVSNNGGTALDAVGCAVIITGSGTGKPGFVDLSNNKGFTSNNLAQAAALTIDHATITSNTGIGIFAQVGSGVLLTGSVTLTGNGAVALQAQVGAVSNIASYNGINTISAANGPTASLFGCFQGGKIYVGQIAGTITPAPTAANQGCLQVGGP